MKPLATSAPVDVVPDHHATCYPAKCVSTLPQRVSRSTSFELPLLIYMLACTASASEHADPREHAAVFSVQHLFCFIRGNTILDSHSDSLGASLQKTGAGSFSKQSILRNPARPAERECSAGYFL